MPSTGDSAVRRTNTYYVEETLDSRGRAQTPTDPAWRLYSSVVSTTEPESSKEDRGRRGLGDVDYIDKNQAQETHELTVEYDLERFPVDGSGNNIDPVADAAGRNVDGELEATHSFMQVVQRGQLIARNTVHEKWFARSDVSASDHPSGSDPGAERRATTEVAYARGGHPEEVAVGVNADDNALVTVEYPYQFQKMRMYQFDDPADVGYLHVVSTDAGDTNLSVTIENDDASTTEDVTTDGTDATTAVATTSTFDDIGRVWVDGEHTGSILIYDDDGSGSGTAGSPAQLCGVIKGSELYDGIEDDRGVPPLGSGSLDDGTSLDGKQYAIGAEVYWEGRALADYHQGTSLTISNDIGEEAATDMGLQMARQAGTREITAETTAFGETASHDHVGDFFEGLEGEYEIRLTDGDITLPRAFISEGGNAAREEGEAFLLPEVTFMALEDVTNGRPAIEFTASS